MLIAVYLNEHILWCTCNMKVMLKLSLHCYHQQLHYVNDIYVLDEVLPDKSNLLRILDLFFKYIPCLNLY